MKKSIVKRLLQEKLDKRKAAQRQKKYEQLSFDFDNPLTEKEKTSENLSYQKTLSKKNNSQVIKSPKHIITVKPYIKKTKKGKLSLVRQHQRVKNILDKFKELKEDSIATAEKIISTRKFDEKSFEKFKKNFDKNLKKFVIKFVIKEMNLKKDDPSLKRRANALYKNIVRETDKIFADKKLVKFENGTKDKGKSKFAFGYFVDGEKIDKINPNSLLYEGYTFYNQDISSDKNWAETLKRKNLKILRIGKSTVEGEKRFQVTLMTNAGNKKLKLKDLGLKKPEEIIKIIKQGL